MLGRPDLRARQASLLQGSWRVDVGTSPGEQGLPAGGAVPSSARSKVFFVWWRDGPAIQPLSRQDKRHKRKVTVNQATIR